ncbi:MAG TPA: alpha/beta hydrolase, partial [Bacillota bacterium]|nr:alpha/beta hydrolase [Bacillota bacterium]
MTDQEKDARRQELMGLLGELPSRQGDVRVETITVEERETYCLEKLLLHLNGTEPVPAYFTKPYCQGKFPAILYNHAHGGKYQLGKDELLLGRGSLQNPPYAEALAQKGIAALAIDAWGFGERRGRTETEIFKEMLWNGQVMWGMMLFDTLRAFDYLTTRPDVDAQRIGTLGLS